LRVSLKIDFGAAGAIGPGKIGLLELIERHGSIAAAGRAMAMSYRRAWILVDELNRSFSAPLVATQHGGTGGGGAALTPQGANVLALYRALVTRLEAEGAGDLAALEAALRVPDVRD
jgi:molybdate transport system regulatory protein